MTAARVFTMSRFFSLVSLGLAFASVGCATEQKVLTTSRYSLSYPEYWKVQSVAKKDGEPTRITIGKYSDTIINEGEAAQGDAIYEKSQAEVDVRIYTWPASGDVSDLNKKVRDLLLDEPDLNMANQGLIRNPGEECGRQFSRKFTILKKEQDIMDLASRPGHRVVVIGGQSDGVLLGVVSRVPFEQDPGLYCYNLKNMHLQLQNLLDGITLTPPKK